MGVDLGRAFPSASADPGEFAALRRLVVVVTMGVAAIVLLLSTVTVVVDARRLSGDFTCALPPYDFSITESHPIAHSWLPPTTTCAYIAGGISSSGYDVKQTYWGFVGGCIVLLASGPGFVMLMRKRRKSFGPR